MLSSPTSSVYSAWSSVDTSRIVSSCTVPLTAASYFLSTLGMISSSSFNRSVTQSIDGSIHQSISQWIGPSVGQSVNQSIKVMCEYDVIHKTGSTQRITTPSKQDGATAIGNMQKNSVEIGRVVPEI